MINLLSSIAFPLCLFSPLSRRLLSCLPFNHAFYLLQSSFYHIHSILTPTSYQSHFFLVLVQLEVLIRNSVIFSIRHEHHVLSRPLTDSTSLSPMIMFALCQDIMLYLEDCEYEKRDHVSGCLVCVFLTDRQFCSVLGEEIKHTGRPSPLNLRLSMYSFPQVTSPCSPCHTKVRAHTE